MYRLQILQAFNLNNWDDEVIEKKTKQLFQALIENENSKKDIEEIINKCKCSEKFKTIISFVGDNKYDLFKILFIYELYDLAHKCFCDFLNTGTIQTDNKLALMKNI